MRTAFILVNGIFNDPGSDNAWTDFGVDWLNLHTVEPTVTVAYEYGTDAIFRSLKQKARTEAIARRADAYHQNGDRVILVGHSNGCDLIARVIKTQQVDEVHLISPATDESELDVGIKAGNVGAVFIYGSTGDLVLKYGARATRILTLGLAGFGSLGLRGPAYAAKHPKIVFDLSDNRHGHGTWLDDHNLIATLGAVATNSGLTLRK